MMMEGGCVSTRRRRFVEFQLLLGHVRSLWFHLDLSSNPSSAKYIPADLPMPSLSSASNSSLHELLDKVLDL